MYLRGADFSWKAIYEQFMTTLNSTLIFAFKDKEHQEQPPTAKQ